MIFQFFPINCLSLYQILYHIYIIVIQHPWQIILVVFIWTASNNSNKNSSSLVHLSTTRFYVFKNLAHTPFLYHVNLFVFRGIKEGKKKKKIVERLRQREWLAQWSRFGTSRRFNFSKPRTIRSCFRKRDKRVKEGET